MLHPPLSSTAAATTSPTPPATSAVIVSGESPIATAIVDALRAAGHTATAARDAGAVADAVAAAQRDGTRIAALINAQHVASASGAALATSERDYDALIARELTAIFRCCKTALPHLIEHGGGAIVNVAGAAAYGRANHTAESAAHGGVIGFSAALAYDHFNDHVRVNTIVAGVAATPADIAPVALFLISPDAEVLSGSLIDVGVAAYQGGA
jgi:NAD(P)-dependent dehydrogenase (short-subunit alcohol dehydrogenase family)